MKMHSKLYIKIMNSKEWKAARMKHLSSHPLCEECLKLGYSVPARAVHHKREVESGRDEADCWKIALDADNLESVCFQCHSELHRGSHKKEAHQLREDDRLKQFKSKVGGR